MHTLASEVLIWTDHDRVELVEAVLGRIAELDVLGVGGPDRRAVVELAERLGTEAHDDLRQMLNDRPARFLLLATPHKVAAEDVRSAMEQGTDVLALQPRANKVEQVLDFQPGCEPPGRLVHVPMLRLSPGWLAAADPLDAVGTVRSVSIAATSPPQSGGLFARLFDAVEMIVSLLDLPDSIDAAMPGLTDSPPDQLSALSGHLTAHFRFATHASATLSVSDAAEAWSRRMTLVGSDGQMIFDDRGYELAAGSMHEAHHIDDAETMDAAELIAQQWRWMLTHRHGPSVVDYRKVLACCQTAVLSARTGQSESPHLLLRMV